MKLEPAVYALVDPRDLAVRYIGASQNWKRRSNIHCSTARSPRLAHLKYPVLEWIRELHASGMEPVAAMLERTDAIDLPGAEVVWVARGRSLGWSLLNATDGGRGSVGLRHKADSLVRMRKIAALRSQEHYAKASAARVGYKWSDAQRAKLIASRKVALIDRRGRRHSCARDAAAALGVSRESIYRGLRGQGGLAGQIWRAA